MTTQQAVSPAPRIVKVTIIEDQREIREGLRFLIGSTDGYQCNGSYGSAEEALTRISEDLPDLILIDIGLPGIDGIDGTRILKERYPEIQIVTLTVYDDDERIFDALCAGASGYLLKKTPPARLIESLKDALNGGAPMSPEVASRLIKIFKDIRPPERADYQLTPHEVRLLKLLVEGHSYKTAAAELGSSVNTIGFHMRSIYRKLQVHSKSEAVVKAMRQRLV
ncbi:MAG TPA: response regulator transcription factor [Pyrinomonadaceae bacterium]|jgi:DNA-binding NarL/FixJ family response regulator|nr:response regulator transcription factor [Pyrinomonadaceae bacterium]